MPDPDPLARLHHQPPFGPSPLDEIVRRAGRIRRRRRHRRSAFASIVAVALAATGVALLPGGGSNGVRVVPAGPSPLRLPATITVGQVPGELAIADGDVLELRAGGVERVLFGPGQVSQPASSPDGDWVAYLRTPASHRYPGYDGNPPQLWVATSSGGDAHQVVSGVQDFSWSPTSDRLAVLAAGNSGSTSLDLVSPTSSRIASIPTNGSPGSFAWSPSGRRLAVGAVLRGAFGTYGTVEIVTAEGGTPDVLNRSPGNGLVVDGWWPDGKGLLVWRDKDFSSSIAADGLPLQSLDLATDRRTTLATTLVYGNWVAWDRAGDAVAVVAGSSRVVWTGGRHVEVCHIPAATCTAVGTPKGAVSLDPAWTSAGQLVWTQSPVEPGSATFGAGTVNAWYARSELVEGSPLRAAGTGAHDATAIPSGLLYVRSGALWYLAIGATAPLRLVGGLRPPPPTTEGYYGYIDWSQDVAWHS